MMNPSASNPNTHDKPRGLLVLSPHSRDNVFGPELLAQVQTLLQIDHPICTPEQLIADPALLKDVKVLVTGWGAPKLDEHALSQADALELVLFGGGTLGPVMTQHAWSRGLRACSAFQANSQAVAEYTVGTILLSLKRFLTCAHEIRQSQSWVRPASPPPGNFQSLVGLVSLGMIGRLVAGHLQAFDHRVLGYDPHFGEHHAALGIESVSLDQLFSQCHVVSLHTPWLKETEKMITESLLRSMPEQATFINTARGAVVDEPALIRVAQDRPDLHFVLDVTYPEPPEPGSPLYRLDNVTLTPHIAGAMGMECRRMGQMMVDDLQRYLAGEPLEHEVKAEAAVNSIHRPRQ